MNFIKLTERGRKFAACLTKFIKMQKELFRKNQLEKYREELKEYEEGRPNLMSTNSSFPEPEPPEPNFLVWTSILKRTIETVEKFDAKEFEVMVIYLILKK